MRLFARVSAIRGNVQFKTLGSYASSALAMRNAPTAQNFQTAARCPSKSMLGLPVFTPFNINRLLYRYTSGYCENRGAKP